MGDVLAAVGPALAVAATVGGVLATVWAVFRIKIRDDTILTQKGYIEALEHERDQEARERKREADEYGRRITTLESRVDALTDEFGKQVGQAIVKSLGPALQEIVHDAIDSRGAA